jgi:hypothetical protein
MSEPIPLKHPFDGTEYTLLEDSTVQVVHVESGDAGIFALDGSRLSGTLHWADQQMLRWTHDAAVPSASIAPGARQR